MGLLALILAVVSVANASQLRPRDYSGCNPLDNLGHLGTSDGNRKIAFVIDSSGSMFENDFEGMRLQAAIALNNMYLVSKEKAKPGQTPDLLTVIDFNDEASVIYDLGNPGSAANEVIANIMPDGGTWIGEGVRAAVEELSKPGSGETSGRSGIIILTDGVDDPSDRATQTIEEIKAAGEKGIRVSMGYMAIGGATGDEFAPEQNVAIHDAVITTGGTMGRVDTAQAIGSFLVEATMKGLTDSDKGNQGDVLDLIGGVTTSAKLKTDGPNVFRYRIFKDETITINVTALEKFAPLKLVLRASPSNTDLKTAETNDDGVAILEYKGASESDLSLEVSSSVTDAKGVFIIGLKSNIDCSKDPARQSSPANSSIPVIAPTNPSFVPSRTVVPSVTNWTMPGPTETVSVVPFPGATGARSAPAGLGWLGSMVVALLAL
ncbi:hypothetical protein BU26DRAFT_516856 [Trematosphaeria pertusa]|uniref:VWFA domain-containing protein n=1 Tax=Trematosphaeria pertusa TaxID=390896 RepID=A0A6A6IRF5_9PLEO|nr:uncharacterized protein BU26DRAFT_516856 [Trematosphaeria pertusa]KAF2252170.1 hypothetical protein BU26DRAFT_516856 [Trematosphaeria pertusa]